MKTTTSLLSARLLDITGAAADTTRGIFTIISPHRTERLTAGLAFALAHARRNGMARVIVVLPWSSPIEETVRLLRPIATPWLIEQHGDLTPERETEMSRLSSENWDGPMVLASDAVFFEGFFAACPAEKRKQHRMTNAVILFDDAQFPDQYLSPCLEALASLVRQARSSLIFTGPFRNPYLDDLQQVGGRKINGLASLTGQSPTRVSIDSSMSRPKIHIRWLRKQEAPLLPQGLARLALGHGVKHAALILNDARTAQRVFQEIKKRRASALYLADTICPAHREAILEKARSRAASGTPAVIVGTALLEQTEGLTFPAVYREFSGLDRLARAAGLCEGPKSKLHVVRMEGSTPDRQTRRGMDLLDAWIARGVEPCPTDPEHLDRYFCEFFSLTEPDAKGILPLLAQLKFDAVAQRFLYADDKGSRYAIAPYKGLDQAIALFENKKTFLYHRLRALQAYVVRLPKEIFTRLEGTGRIQRVPPFDVPFISSGAKIYHPDIGLDLDRA